MKKFLFSAAALVLSALNLSAQSGEWSFGIGSEAMTQYMWHGLPLSSSPTVVPTASVNFENDDFSFEAGFCSVTELQRGHYLEMDLWASATYRGFTFMAQEYGMGDNLGLGGYSDNLELSLGYELPFEVPASLTWNTFVAGDDFNGDGSRAFSSYVELCIPYDIDDFSFSFTAGAVPFASDEMYGTEGFTVTNLSLQAGYNFSVGENLELPVYIQDTYSPFLEHNFVVLGCSLTYSFAL